MKFFFLVISNVLFILSAFGQANKITDKPAVDSQSIKVTLLGTGTPIPLMVRFGPGILVQAGGQTLLFDAGRGCLQRMRQLNLSYDKLNALFLTHLHSDHIIGLPDLWLTGWLLSRRATPLNVFGPSGTDAMVKNLQKAYEFDIRIRIEDDKTPVEGSKLFVKEIQEGVIYEKDGVKVIAFEVDHYPIVPAFGYRVEYNGHSVVLSGDTRYSKNLIKFAKGSDLLIHEVVVAPDTMSKLNPDYHIFAHHTSIEEVSRIFNEVHPKLGVYSHIVNLHRSDQDLLDRTKANYSGQFIIGQDLMSISIGDSVSVRPWHEE